MLPLAIPAIVTVAVLQFIQIWGDLLIGLLFLQTPDVRTITVGLATLQSSRDRPRPGAHGRVDRERPAGDHRLPDLPAAPDRRPDDGGEQVSPGGRSPRQVPSMTTAHDRREEIARLVDEEERVSVADLTDPLQGDRRLDPTRPDDPRGCRTPPPDPRRGGAAPGRADPRRLRHEAPRAPRAEGPDRGGSGRASCSRATSSSSTPERRSPRSRPTSPAAPQGERDHGGDPLAAGRRRDRRLGVAPPHLPGRPLPSGLPGGRRPAERSTALRDLSADIVFLGCDGLTIETGLTTPAHARRGGRGDHGGARPAGGRGGRFEQARPPGLHADRHHSRAVDVLITDDGADPDQVEPLREAGIDVILA